MARKPATICFRQATVAHVPEFFNLIKGFSERPDAQPDFFEFYTLTPGHLLPPKWYLWIQDAARRGRITRLPARRCGNGLACFSSLPRSAAIYWAIWRLPHRRIAAARSVADAPDIAWR